MSLKNSIRELTLGAEQKFRTKDLEYKGCTVRVKELSLKERKQVLQRSKDADGTIDEVKLTINAIIAMVIDPDTGEKVYSPADYDSMVNSPAGGYVEVFSKTIFDLFTPEAEDEGKDQMED